jgi:hypothetical protein
MAHRTVVDADGLSWEIWEVQPLLDEKRAVEHAIPPATTGERRILRSVRLRLPGEMKGGWLALKSESERRRIAPIPEGWLTMNDDELRELVARGTPTGRSLRHSE